MEDGDDDGALRVAVDRAHDLLDEDRPEAALGALEAALVERSASVSATAEAMGLAAVAARGLGRDVEARRWSDRAIAALEELPARGRGASRVLASVLEDRAELELATRAAGTAAALLRRAIALRAEHGEDASAETWLALAEAAHRAGALDEAADAIARAERAAGAEGDRESAALARELSADVALDRAEPDAAASAYAAAERAWRALGDREGVVRCLVGRARAAERHDDAAALEAICATLDAMGERARARRLRDGDVG